jgi:hypothetical protein
MESNDGKAKWAWSGHGGGALLASSSYLISIIITAGIDGVLALVSVFLPGSGGRGAAVGLEWNPILWGAWLVGCVALQLAIGGGGGGVVRRLAKGDEEEESSRPGEQQQQMGKQQVARGGRRRRGMLGLPAKGKKKLSPPGGPTNLVLGVGPHAQLSSIGSLFLDFSFFSFPSPSLIFWSVLLLRRP